MRKVAIDRRQEQGQALVEFIVAAIFFLVPLFLAIAVLGKLTDVQHVTTMAGRYATWERTVWYDDAGTTFHSYNGANHKTAAEIGNELAARLINDHSLMVSVIRKNDKNATDFINGTDPMWRDNEGKKYLNSYDQGSLSVTKTSPTTDIAGGALSAIAALPLPTGVVGTLVPPVPNDTLATAAVSLNKIARNSAAYQRLWPQASVWGVVWEGFDFTSGGAILSNTWYANGSDSTRQMVAESVPTAKGLGSAVEVAAKAAISIWDPTIPPRIDLGKIAPDVVPEDRLK